MTRLAYGLFTATLVAALGCGARSEFFFTGDASADGGACTTPACLNDPTFRLLSVSNTGCAVSNNVESAAGDQRGVLVVTPTNVLYTGDNRTVRLSTADLSGIAATSAQHDTLVSDLRAGTAYVMLDAGGSEPRSSNVAQITQLGELDANSGELTARRVALSRSLNLSMGNGLGFYSGYGRIVLWISGGADAGYWQIAMPGGAVTQLAGRTSPDGATGCESWAHSGVVEYFGGDHYVVFARGAATNGVARQRVRDGALTMLMTTPTMGDVCTVGFSPERQRWYFQYEATPAFVQNPPGMNGEFVGACTATFDRP